MPRRPLDPDDRSTLAAYLRLARSLPAISRERELEAAEAVARHRCPISRQLLISANLRLVADIARPYAGRGMPLRDLLGAANAGLLRAVDEFDPTVGIRFSTHACWWIKQAVRAALASRKAAPQTAQQPVHAGATPETPLAPIARTPGRADVPSLRELTALSITRDHAAAIPAYEPGPLPLGPGRQTEVSRLAEPRPFRASAGRHT